MGDQAILTLSSHGTTRRNEARRADDAHIEPAVAASATYHQAVSLSSWRFSQTSRTDAPSGWRKPGAAHQGGGPDCRRAPAPGIQYGRAGRTGIEPAPCGCGACCRSFNYVQGRARGGSKSPIL